jgi:hypothetical protein
LSSFSRLAHGSALLVLPLWTILLWLVVEQAVLAQRVVAALVGFLLVQHYQ